jgi:hypothetical protein
VVTFCDIKGGYSGTGNIDQDPLFSDPSGGDYHLTWLSPCINRGTHVGAPPDDMDGDPRPCMGTPDMGADEFTGTHPLASDVFTCPPSGGTANLTLYASNANPLRSYFVLGSITGTAPGFPLPGGLMLPLNWDVFTDLVYEYANTPFFVDFHGTLDGSGNGTARFNPLGLLPPNITMHFAYLLYDPLDFVSNPVAIEIVP